ncbi:MAG: hypothetical protein AB7U41_06310 [Dongiaceae bacterium]
MALPQFENTLPPFEATLVFGRNYSAVTGLSPSAVDALIASKTPEIIASLGIAGIGHTPLAVGRMAAFAWAVSLYQTTKNFAHADIKLSPQTSNHTIFFQAVDLLRSFDFPQKPEYDEVLDQLRAGKLSRKLVSRAITKTNFLLGDFIETTAWKDRDGVILGRNIKPELLFVQKMSEVFEASLSLCAGPPEKLDQRVMEFLDENKEPAQKHPPEDPGLFLKVGLQVIAGSYVKAAGQFLIQNRLVKKLAGLVNSAPAEQGELLKREIQWRRMVQLQMDIALGMPKCEGRLNATTGALVLGPMPPDERAKKLQAIGGENPAPSVLENHWYKIMGRQR